MVDIVLFGNLSAWTKDEQTTMFDTDNTAWRSYGRSWSKATKAQDMSEVIEYRKHHGFVIYSLSQWPSSDDLTCWNPKVGATTVDYLMGSPHLIPKITKFTISSKPIDLAADHAYLCVEVKMNAQGMHMLRGRVGWLKTNLLRRQLICIVVRMYNGMLDLECPKWSYTRIVKVSAYQPQKHFPTQWAMHPNVVESYKIIGMMRDVEIQGDVYNAK